MERKEGEVITPEKFLEKWGNIVQGSPQHEALVDLMMQVDGAKNEYFLQRQTYLDPRGYGQTVFILGDDIHELVKNGIPKHPTQVENATPDLAKSKPGISVQGLLHELQTQITLKSHQQ